MQPRPVPRSAGVELDLEAEESDAWCAWLVGKIKARMARAGLRKQLRKLAGDLEDVLVHARRQLEQQQLLASIEAAAAAAAAVHALTRALAAAKAGGSSSGGAAEAAAREPAVAKAKAKRSSARKRAAARRAAAKRAAGPAKAAAAKARHAAETAGHEQGAGAVISDLVTRMFASVTAPELQAAACVRACVARVFTNVKLRHRGRAARIGGRRFRRRCDAPGYRSCAAPCTLRVRDELAARAARVADAAASARMKTRLTERCDNAARAAVDLEPAAVVASSGTDVSNSLTSHFFAAHLVLSMPAPATLFLHMAIRCAILGQRFDTTTPSSTGRRRGQRARGLQRRRPPRRRYRRRRRAPRCRQRVVRRRETLDVHWLMSPVRAPSLCLLLALLVPSACAPR